MEHNSTQLKHNYTQLNKIGTVRIDTFFLDFLCVKFDDIFMLFIQRGGALSRAAWKIPSPARL